MADSEVKARRKLEEAEKKCRGGGGFLGKIFGGNCADEAADLFIQDNSESLINSDSDDLSAVKGTLSSGEEDFLECDLCGQDFPNIVAFESHYKSAHSYQCKACFKMFINQKTLNIHSDEVHCPFYRLRVEKNPSGNHFQCYDEDCMKIFTTGEDRDDHCRKHHNINNVEFNIERRKLPKRVQKLEKTFNQMNLAPRRNRVPRIIRFGDQEKSFRSGRQTI